MREDEFIVVGSDILVNHFFCANIFEHATLRGAKIAVYLVKLEKSDIGRREEFIDKPGRGGAMRVPSRTCSQTRRNQPMWIERNRCWSTFNYE